MPQGGEVADVSPISPFLIGFKPRQVLLAERQQQLRNSKLPTPMAKNQDMESVLACSVALWLENKGYSKILKRFLSLAQIQDDDWRAKAHDLNEVFSKHLATTKDVVVDASSQKKKELEIVGSVQINRGANGCSGEEIETKKKKKKKKNKVGDALAVPAKTSDEVAADTRGRMSDLSSDSNTEKANELPVDQSHKLKKDKKKKGTDTVAESIDNLTDTGKAVESKDKKKKKKLKDNNMEVDKDCDLGSKRKEDAATTESKQASKKRKRVVDDEAENEPEKEMAVQELKPKKSKGEKEGKDIQVQDTVPAKHVGESNMEDLKNGVDSFSQPKSGRKQNGNSSAEPTSVNAFQRVKIDEVEFADERLQDNSYWAKHGAETGYGAKAQEVLGQVRGRDFRHEKTKKKRGSYRGGVIDLQSHSIKFDNSDDE